MKHKLTAHLVPQGERRETDNGLETDYKIAICDEQAEIKEGDWLFNNEDGSDIHQKENECSNDFCHKIIAAYTLPNIPTISKEIAQVIVDNPNCSLECEMVERCCTGTINGGLQSPDCNHTCSIWSYGTDAHGNIDVRVVNSEFEHQYGEHIKELDAIIEDINNKIDSTPVEDEVKDEAINNEKKIRALAEKSCVENGWNSSGDKHAYAAGFENGYIEGYTAASKDLFTKEDVKWTDKLVSLYQDYCHVSFCLDEDADIPEPAEWLSDYLATKTT